MPILKRFESVWDQVSDLQKFDVTKLQKDVETAVVRTNRYNSSIVHAEFHHLDLSLLTQKFYLLQFMLQGRCKSMKLTFDMDNAEKDLLISILESLDFECGETGIWVYRHSDFNVSVITVQSYENCEWILLIEKRKGNGLPVTACDLAKLFDTQLSLPLDRGIAS